MKRYKIKNRMIVGGRGSGMTQSGVAELYKLFDESRKNMVDLWCNCPLQGRGQCPETPEFIEGCKEFSRQTNKLRNS